MKNVGTTINYYVSGLKNVQISNNFPKKEVVQFFKSKSKKIQKLKYFRQKPYLIGINKNQTAKFLINVTIYIIHQDSGATITILLHSENRQSSHFLHFLKKKY